MNKRKYYDWPFRGWPMLNGMITMTLLIGIMMGTFFLVLWLFS